MDFQKAKKKTAYKSYVKAWIKKNGKKTYVKEPYSALTLSKHQSRCGRGDKEGEDHRA